LQKRHPVSIHQRPGGNIKPHIAVQSLTAAASGNGHSSNFSKGPVLVVPAFYLDAAAFKPLVQELRSQGFNAALPPIRCHCLLNLDTELLLCMAGRASSLEYKYRLNVAAESARQAAGAGVLHI